MERGQGVGGEAPMSHHEQVAILAPAAHGQGHRPILLALTRHGGS